MRTLAAVHDELAEMEIGRLQNATDDPVRATIDDATAELFGLTAETVADWRSWLSREPFNAQHVAGERLTRDPMQMRMKNAPRRNSNERDTAGPGENLARHRQMSHFHAGTIHLQVILQRG